MAKKKRAALIVCGLAIALAAGCSEPGSSDSRADQKGKAAEGARASSQTNATSAPAVATSASSPVNVIAGKELAAAGKFLATLDEAQRKKVLFDMNDSAQRKRWSNLPASAFPRAGLRMADLTRPQRDSVMEMLKTMLSAEGYEKVSQITRAGGENAPDQYYVSILGKPSETEAWMLQFGGHHLALNITMAGAKGTMAPSHTGASPATYQIAGKAIRPLGDEVDKAFALMGSLSDAQKKQAIIGAQFRDLVLGPGRDGQTISPEGVKGTDLTDKQRAMLLDLASEWTGIMHDANAKAKMEEMKKNIGETWFCWSGPTEKGAAAYFRIQGPTVVIEYAPQGGTNHIHTIYRDPTNDYGAAWWKK